MREQRMENSMKFKLQLNTILLIVYLVSAVGIYFDNRSMFFGTLLASCVLILAAFVVFGIVVESNEKTKMKSKVRPPSLEAILVLFAAPLLIYSGNPTAAVVGVIYIMFWFYLSRATKNLSPISKALSEDMRGLARSLELGDDRIIRHDDDPSRIISKRRGVEKNRIGLVSSHTIMFEMSSTIGKMISLMEEEDANVFIGSFKDASALQDWVEEELMPEWIRYFRSDKTTKEELKRKRENIRKFTEEKVMELIKEKRNETSAASN